MATPTLYHFAGGSATNVVSCCLFSVLAAIVQLHRGGEVREHAKHPLDMPLQKIPEDRGQKSTATKIKMVLIPHAY